MLKYIYLVLSLGVFVGCASSPKYASKSEVEADTVVSRIDDLKERPEWLKESEPFQIKNGTVFSLGSTTLSSDSRVEAGFRISQNNAKAAIAHAIEQKLEYTFQNAEEGTSLDSAQARYIGSEFTSLTTSSIRSKSVYWEKVATTLDSGERVTRYKIFSMVTMPEQDFKAAMFKAIKNGESQGKLSKDFQDRVNAQWDRFVGAPSEVKREAASE